MKERFTWRHNSALTSLCNHLNKNVCRDFKIFADLANYENPGYFFKSKRPDIVIIDSIIIEEEKTINLKNYYYYYYYYYYYCYLD